MVKTKNSLWNQKRQEIQIPSVSKSLYAWNYYFRIIWGIAATAFRGLPNQLTLQLQFPCFCSKVQLHEIISLGNFQEFSAIKVTWFDGFRILNEWISKRMVSKEMKIRVLVKQMLAILSLSSSVSTIGDKIITFTRRKSTRKRSQFVWTSFSEQSPLGSWLVS